MVLRKGSTSADSPQFNLTEAERLIRLEKHIDRPHVVILGAGASVAAFPHGDATGKRLPVMANIAEVLGLDRDLAKEGIDPKTNFEALYSELHRTKKDRVLLRLIEQRVEEYFKSLQLPNHPTLYDLLLLSLRRKDVIFTFNWDPFLALTYARHASRYVKLPQIFHLHGNVLVGYCKSCETSGDIRRKCARCGGELSRTRLLYPVQQKDYTKDPFISSQWDQARYYLRNAFLITFFGYSAPKTDQAAMEILTKAWKGVKYERLFEQVEIIDIRPSLELEQQWAPFAFFGHYQIHRSIFASRLALYPRRSCEALYSTNVEGNWTSEVPWGWNLVGLVPAIAELQKYEPQEKDKRRMPKNRRPSKEEGLKKRREPTSKELAYGALQEIRNLLGGVIKSGRLTVDVAPTIKTCYDIAAAAVELKK